MPPRRAYAFPSYTELLSAQKFCNEIECAQYLMDMKILPTKHRCSYCDVHMKLRPCSRSMYRERCCWKCSCGTTKSIRAESVLEGSSISYSSFILLLSCFAEELLPPAAAARCVLSENTVRRLYTIIRQQMAEELATSNMIGGPGRVVELDEAKFGKQKYNRGRLVEGTWVIGGVERGSSSCFMKVLPLNKRDAATMIPIIQQHVAPGTTIITDCWRAYNRLSSLGYIHLTVNHSRQFVDPVTGAHTNGVEGTWTHAKRATLRRGGRRSPDSLDADLSAFAWMRQHGLTGDRDRARHLFSRDIPRLLNYRKFRC